MVFINPFNPNQFNINTMLFMKVGRQVERHYRVVDLKVLFGAEMASSAPNWSRCCLLKKALP